MSTKPPLKIQQRRVVDMDQISAPEDLVKKFNTAFDELNHILVDRTNEVEALKLCVLSKNHLMLDGLHGTSKSKMAHEAFRRISGAVVFKKQFMKGTQSDEIFGPMKSERYREDAVWEHNTEGMLPEAHFAYLDEVYRASDLLLPSMMGILNEREFINGGIVQKCPLITAIGTTNFVSSEEELDAFRDRFLVTSKVQPLANGQSRLRMINAFLMKQKSNPTIISLDELVQVQKLTRSVKFSDEILGMYEELVSRYKRSLGTAHYVSDRRYCETLRILQAFHVIQEGGYEEEDFQPENLIAASYGLCRQNEDKETDAFQQAFQAVVGDYVKTQKEVSDFQALLGSLSTIETIVSATGASTKKKRKMFDRTKIVLDSLLATPPDEQPATVRGKELFEECKNKATSLVNDLANEIGATI